jgi:hypothetical protein
MQELASMVFDSRHAGITAVAYVGSSRRGVRDAGLCGGQKRTGRYRYLEGVTVAADAWAATGQLDLARRIDRHVAVFVDDNGRTATLDGDPVVLEQDLGDALVPEAGLAVVEIL